MKTVSSGSLRSAFAVVVHRNYVFAACKAPSKRQWPKTATFSETSVSLVFSETGRDPRFSCENPGSLPVFSKRYQLTGGLILRPHRLPRARGGTGKNVDQHGDATEQYQKDKPAPAAQPRGPDEGTKPGNKSQQTAKQENKCSEEGEH